MDKVSDEITKKYDKLLNKETIEEIVENYQACVKKKIDLFFEVIKLNSNNGQVGLDSSEACQWVDAAQNVLYMLFEMLKALDTTESQNITNDFIFKVRANLAVLAQKEVGK